MILHQAENMPVHRSMREISELIYETCKTYLSPGQIPAAPRNFIGRGHRPVLRSAAEDGSIRVAIIILFSLVWHRGQLRRGVVRH